MSKLYERALELNYKGNIITLARYEISTIFDIIDEDVTQEFLADNISASLMSLDITVSTRLRRDSFENI